MAKYVHPTLKLFYFKPLAYKDDKSLPAYILRLFHLIQRNDNRWHDGIYSTAITDELSFEYKYPYNLTYYFLSFKESEYIQNFR
jgi:hypothetical protein